MSSVQLVPSVKAVVLAGGFGTRVQHLLPGIPKPMALVNGRPFLEYVIEFIGSAGIEEVVISTGYLSEIIELHFSSRRFKGIPITCSRETIPLGTAGGFRDAMRAAAEGADTWLVANGDSLAIVDLPDFIHEFRRGGWDAALVGLKVADAGRYGSLVVGHGGELLSFAEKQPGVGVINAGLYLFSNSIVADFERQRPLSFEVDVFPSLLRDNKRILVYETEVPFLDIGTPESLAASEQFVSSLRSRAGADGLFNSP